MNESIAQPIHRRRPRASWFCLVILIVLTLGASGCGRYRADVTTYAAPIPENGVVFVVDGAGDFQGASEYLNQAVRLNNWPIQVVTFQWSHGYRRIVADQTDFPYARAKGKELAERILACRAEHPDKALFLFAHSAGAAPALAALEQLPPDTLKRAIFISPSVSARYAVANSLGAVKEGLHNFYSPHDLFHLGFAVCLLGNVDGPRSFAAGRIGFHYPSVSGSLAGRLIQRGWQPEDRLLGNGGGHFGNYQPDFMRQHILPLLQ